MESNKIGYWLQVGANIGILAGLILVGFQINQNTKIAHADLTARSYELTMQLNRAMMGENPAAALAKAGTDPSSLTDEELIVINNFNWAWWNHNTRYELLNEQGLVEEADRELYLRNHARVIFAGNPISAEVWKNMVSNGYSRDWERIVDAEIQRIEPTAYQELIKQLRKVASGD